MTNKEQTASGVN